MATPMTTLTPVPGQSPPLAVLSPSDHSAILLITTSIGLVFALISILIRFFVRLEFRHSFAPDDVLATLSMIFAVAQSSTVFVATSAGFGKLIGDVSVEGLVKLQKANYAGDVLYLLTICLTKCSVAALFLRLSPNTGHSRMSHIILAFSSLATFISILLICLRCDLAEPWIYIGAKCTALLTRWQVVAVFDAVSELGLFATSVYMVKDLQLSLSKKAVVIMAFALRLPVLVPIGFRLHYLDVDLHGDDNTMTGVLVQVMTQTEISYAIIAATIPCLRPFMTALSTNYGAPAPDKRVGSTYGGLEYSLNSISKPAKLSRGKKSRDPSRRGEEEEEQPQFRWDLPGHEHMTTVERGDGHSMESHESKQMIIERNTEWVVEYETKEGESPLQSPRAGSARYRSGSEEEIGVTTSHGSGSEEEIRVATSRRSGV